MIKKNYKGYIFLFCFLLSLLSLSIPTIEWLRGSSSSLFSPFWNTFSHLKVGSEGKKENLLVQKLQIENNLLKDEMQQLMVLLNQERQHAREAQKDIEDKTTPSFQRRITQIKNKLKGQLQAIPAKIIFRSPEAWSNFVWINVGSANNVGLKNSVVAKNSPVVLGNSLVGVIEEVGSHQSKVRLITDPNLNPSVRIARGDLQKQHSLDLIHQILTSNIISQVAEKEEIISFRTLLSTIEAKIKKSQNGSTAYLAKGILHGRGNPIWRSHGNVLHGIGFNYDFEDEEGPAQDLRTKDLIHVNDLLITTGTDGIFPPGFYVAEVTKIYPLREGDFYYELDAVPTAGNLDDLSVVFVLPPIGYEPES